MNNRDFFYTLKTTKIMKTGGTLNFLKRAGAILMLVAVFASSCNKYADDFKQLNTKLDGLASSIGAMSTLTTDLASVKASVASALTAIAAIPNPTASITALQTSLTAANASIATINTNLTALTTTVNGLPKLADVNAIATKVSADLTTQLAVTNKAVADALAALKTNEASVQTAIIKAITDNNATLNALVQGDLVANNVAISKAIADNNTAISKAIADNNAQTAALLTANTTSEVAAINAAIVANNAAINTAMLGNNTAVATLIQAQITALQTALAGTSTDAVTAATINGLTAQLAAMKVTLTTVYNNTIKTPGVPTISITGGYATPSVGCTMNVALATTLETATYQWRISGVGTTTYTDIAGATGATYVPVLGDIGKTILVVVTGTGNYSGTNTSVASAAVVANIALTSVNTPVLNSTTGTDVLGQVSSKLKLGTLSPTTVANGATVTYQWQTSPTLTGVYTTVGTSSTYTPVAVDASSYLRVVVTGTGGWNGVVTSGSLPITVAPIPAVQFTAGISNNLVTITLNDGTFKGTTATYPNSDLVITDFAWTGENAGLFIASQTVVTKKSATQATVQLTGALKLTDNSVNAVAIPALTLATPSNGFVPVASAAIAVTPITSVVSGSMLTTVGANTIVITLSGGTFASAITNASFNFAGPDAALINAGTFTRTSSTVVTVTNVTACLGSTNVVTVLPAGQATQATSVAGAGWTSVTSTPVTMLAANNEVTIVLTSGTFATSISQSSFTFAGTDAVALAAGTVTRVNGTTAVVSGLSGLVGTNNTVTVKAAAMSAQTIATCAVAATPSTTIALNSPAFSCSVAAGTITVNLTGGSFHSVMPATAFSSSTCTLGAITYVNANQVTIAVTAATVGSNVITLNAIGQLTPGTSIAVTGF